MKLPAFSNSLPVTALLLVWALGCRGAPAPEAGDPTLALHLAISPTPPVVGPARLLLTLTDRNGQGVEGASIQVEGNMSHAGMVPVLENAVQEGEGRYAVAAFRFTMAGDWILAVKATLPDGRWKEVRYATRVTGGGGGGRSP